MRMGWIECSPVKSMPSNESNLQTFSFSAHAPHSLNTFTETSTKLQGISINSNSCCLKHNLLCAVCLRYYMACTIVIICTNAISFINCLRNIFFHQPIQANPVPISISSHPPNHQILYGLTKLKYSL